MLAYLANKDILIMSHFYLEKYIYKSLQKFKNNEKSSGV